MTKVPKTLMIIISRMNEYSFKDFIKDVEDRQFALTRIMNKMQIAKEEENRTKER